MSSFVVASAFVNVVVSTIAYVVFYVLVVAFASEIVVAYVFVVVFVSVTASDATTNEDT